MFAGYARRDDGDPVGGVRRTRPGSVDRVTTNGGEPGPQDGGVSSDSQDADDDPDARDARLMRQLVLARGRPDGALSAELILSKLLARHEPNIRRIVNYRIYTKRPSKADVDEIINTVMIGVAKALEGDFDVEVPFGAIVAKNIDWDVIDWVRSRERRAAEISTAVVDVPYVDPGEEQPSLVDEARRLRELIDELPGRDHEIVAQRMLFGLRPNQIAEIHGITRNAVDVATHRALKKLEADEAVMIAHEELGVRDSARPSEKRS
jgi:RNA polymerase sigma factor (sigma-70 family)